MVKPIVTIDGVTPMAQDFRPFRTGAFALFFVAAAIFALGLWAQLNAGSSDPVMQFVTGAVLPHVEGRIPAFLGQAETPFGTFAQIGGIVALAGLLLFTLRGAGQAKTTVPAMPQVSAANRVVPRRPAALRAAKTTRLEVAEAAPAATVEAEPSPPATPRNAGRAFQRAALMLIGTVLIGLGAVYALGRASLPVPAFTPPALPAAPAMVPMAIAVAATLLVAAVALRMIRRRRAAA
jgi:hypothetical protein